MLLYITNYILLYITNKNNAVDTVSTNKNYAVDTLSTNKTYAVDTVSTNKNCTLHYKCTQQWKWCLEYNNILH